MRIDTPRNPTLLTIRGASGAGKSTVTASLRNAYGRGLATVSQDVVRRTILRERDVPGGANIRLLQTIAQQCLAEGYHTVVEGILTAEHYGPMLADLIGAHAGPVHAYYLDVPFTETLRRHATRPQAAARPTCAPGTESGTFCPGTWSGSFQRRVRSSRP